MKRDSFSNFLATTGCLVFLLGCGLIVVEASDVNSVARPYPTEDKLWCEYQGQQGPGKGKRIVLIAGDDEYRSEEFMPMLGKILAQHHGFDVTVLFPVNPETKLIQPNFQTNIPGMHRIEGADLVVVGLRFRHLPDSQMKYFHDYLQSGRPVIGIRTSTHAFRYPADSNSPYRHYSFDNRTSTWPAGFGKEILGETWVSHHGRHGTESTRGVVPADKQSHPILTGVSDVWGDTDVYEVRPLPEDAEVLMLGQIIDGMQPTDPAVNDQRNDPMMPIAWTRHYPFDENTIARVFCTTMGAATDFQNPGLRRMLINACYWCLGMEAQIPAEANVEIVGEYRPTPFGFGTEKTDLKPSDFCQSE